MLYTRFLSKEKKPFSSGMGSLNGNSSISVVCSAKVVSCQSKIKFTFL